MNNQELNMKKILEITEKYFEGNKDVKLTDLQMKLLKNVAEYDDATNNLIKWLNDAIENGEERSIENYFDEVLNAYEMQLSEKEARTFEQDLKKLNPDVKIKLSKNCTSIDISKPVKELKLPENFYLDENNRITNKENTALSVFVSLKVNEINEKEKNVRGEKNMTKKDKLDDEELEEVKIEETSDDNPKKDTRKPKFRLFKALKKGFNFIKNKFIVSNDTSDEELDLDNETSENAAAPETTKPSPLKNETLGSMVEKYQMLGYEVELRTNEATSYYKEHENEIIKGSKAQLEKYAAQLRELKELETQYSILKHKVDARRKFEAKKMDQLINAKYEKKDNMMYDQLSNIDNLYQELRYKKREAKMYFKKYNRQINSGSQQHLKKYSEKLAKIKEVEQSISLTKGKYKSLRKEKQESYNMLFR